ncbi:hypothetical protein ABTL40_19260, partial [Acinetobacter baumannii]
AENKFKECHLKKGKQRYYKYIKSAKKNLFTYLKQEIKKEEGDPFVETKVVWYTTKLPVKKHTPVGEVRLIKKDGSIFKKETLYAFNEIKRA